MRNLRKSVFVAVAVLLFGVPSSALALLYTMDFGAGDLQYKGSYTEDPFRVSAMDDGSDGINHFNLTASDTDRNLQIHEWNNTNEILIDHFGLAFDLVSLDIEMLDISWRAGDSMITASSGANLLLDDFGLGTVYFDSVDWQNITSFTIETTSRIQLDNFVFENEATRAPAPVPEPGTILLLGAGLLGLVCCRIIRKREDV